VGNQWTEIVCILDRSGSMGGLESDTISGFNSFLQRQRAVDGRARLTLVLFDGQYELVWQNVDIQLAGELTEQLYFVRGGTALLDALGRTVADTRHAIAMMPEDERPTRVVVLVVTDGEENSSREYSLAQIKDIVVAQQADGWKFVFIGAGIDAFGAAKDMGMAPGAAAVVDRTATGTQLTYINLDRIVTHVRRIDETGHADDDPDEDH